MTVVVLVILAVVWGLYLASWLRNRAQDRSVNSISSFNKHLSVLERARPHGIDRSTGLPVGFPSGTPRVRSSLATAPPGVRPIARRNGMTRGDARRRRRDGLVILGAAVAVTLVPALVIGGSFVYAGLAASAIFLTYLFLVVRRHKLAAERREKVRFLPQSGAPVPEPALALQRSAN